jgi:hypothetical protein
MTREGSRKARRRRSLLVAVGILALPWLLAVFVLRLVLFDEAPKEELLLRSDHGAVLAACREIMEKQGTYRVNPSVGGGGSAEDRRRRSPDPTDPRIPEVIRSLGPSSIQVESDRVVVEMGGGFYHYGFVALSEESCASWENKNPGAREVRRCLWYYAE